MSRYWQTNVGGEPVATGDGSVEPGVGGREAVIRSAMQGRERADLRARQHQAEIDIATRRATARSSKARRNRRTNQRKINLPENVIDSILVTYIVRIYIAGIIFLYRFASKASWYLCVATCEKIHELRDWRRSWDGGRATNFSAGWRNFYIDVKTSFRVRFITATLG